MIYKTIFDLRGTTTQQSIVKSALDKIMFPWTRIVPPNGKFIIGWANLNGQTLKNAKLHKGDHPGKDTDVDPLEGEINGREYILGVFYPSSGNIYIDNALVKYPDIAKTTVSAEIAHLVDYFLPLTNAMRTQISNLMHGGDATDHGHSWWEKVDYGAEYYTLVGESFMQAFTVAYSDMPFSTTEWTHFITKAQAPALRKILGIERTDYIAPTVQNVTPSPNGKYYTRNNSKLYHVAHKGVKGEIFYDTIAQCQAAGLQPCRACRADKM